MKTVAATAAICLCTLTGASAFTVPTTTRTTPLITSSGLAMGYLDDLSDELRSTADPNPNPDTESREATRLDKKDVDRGGVGNWDSFVDFEEFDGGDGQMGVAGDGKKGLDKEWSGAAEMAKSKTMSAKNAWGKTTGYAEELRGQGVETSRAQQLENWRNQQEVLAERNAQKFMTEQFDQVSGDEDWRNLGSFGVERNQVRWVDLDVLGV